MGRIIVTHDSHNFVPEGGFPTCEKCGVKAATQEATKKCEEVQWSE